MTTNAEPLSPPEHAGAAAANAQAAPAVPIVARASATDRAEACPPSSIPPEVRIAGGPAPDAQIGNAVHAALADVALGRPINLSALAQVYQVDLAELERLVEYGDEAWRELGPIIIGSPRVEVPVERLLPGKTVLLRGRPDIAPSDPSESVTDWKAGHRTMSGSCQHQMRAYCWMTGARRAVVVWLRDRSYELLPGPGIEDRWTDEEMEAWAADLERRVLNPDDYPYAPGPACRYCPRALECPALGKMQEGTVRWLAAIEGKAGEITVQQMVAAYQAIGPIERAIGAFKTAVKARLQAGDTIQADGVELVLRPNVRDRIDVRAGWAVLSSWFPAEELGKLVTTTKTALIKAAEATAPKGTKQATGKLLMGELLTTGAIDRVHGAPKLVCRALKK